LAEVGVARRKAWPAVEKSLLKFSIIMDLSVVTVLPSLSAVGSWEEMVLFSMDFTVSQNFLELELQDANFCLKEITTVSWLNSQSKFPVWPSYHNGHMIIPSFIDSPVTIPQVFAVNENVFSDNLPGRIRDKQYLDKKMGCSKRCNCALDDAFPGW
jgi:hypothetical protein